MNAEIRIAEIREKSEARDPKVACLDGVGFGFRISGLFGISAFRYSDCHPSAGDETPPELAGEDARATQLLRETPLRGEYLAENCE